MQLGLDLAIAGHAPVFCPDAKVTGLLPTDTLLRAKGHDGSMVTRTLLKQVPHLLKASVRQKRFDLLAIAWVCVPPLSLLVMMWAAATWERIS